MLRSREWPLIIFTVCSQMAVGMLLAWVTLQRGLVSDVMIPGIPNREPVLLIIGGVLLIGVIAATYHLSHPGRVVHAMANLGSSGLSREMLAGLLFGVAYAAYAASEWFGLMTEVARTDILLAAGVTGVVFIVVMARAYRIRTVPAWDHLATPISFFGTTFTLGMLGVGTHVLIANLDYELWIARVQGFATAAALILGVQLITIIQYLAHLNTKGGAAAESARIVFVRHRAVVVVRLAVAFAGVALFNLAAFAGGGWALLAFLLVLIAEVLGRFLFFASHRRVGL